MSGPSTRSRPGIGIVLLRFLGSMNLAITLLVAIAIAAVIGTVLQQNQPYQDYIFKFGPFWFEVFKSLGLFDIYSAPWFILLLAALLVSTSVCVYRNAPAIFRDMRHFRLDVQEKSLDGFRHRARWLTGVAPAEVAGKAGGLLRHNGYQVRERTNEGVRILGAMKGGWSRAGYLLSHLGIVVICIGGLIDSNLSLKLADYTGKIKIARDVAISDAPRESILSPDSLSFRGGVTIPEGGKADFVLLGLRDGFLVQKLPFTVALEDFRVDYYLTGQPKSFESDLVIHDQALDEPLRRTIAVNHPLIYKGYAIYQASFEDGGSLLHLKGWFLDQPQLEPVSVDGRVGTKLELNTPRGRRSLELIDFKRHNIFPLPKDDPSGKRFQDYGPSVIFKLRDPSGQALEYVNYQTPVNVGGRYFFLSGVRGSQAEEYRFLHIPLDPQASVVRFMRFRALALDEQKLRAAAQRQAGGLLDQGETAERAEAIVGSIVNLVQLFVEEGIDAVVARTEQAVPEGKRREALSSYISVIQGILADLYLEVLRTEGVDTTHGVGEEESRFFDDALNAIALVGPYGSPLYFELPSFEQLEASGLQISRAPGKDIVYLGCIMLIVGVFFMFYLHHRRLWVMVMPGKAGSEILFAGSGHRERAEFTREFEGLRAALQAAAPPASAREV